MKNQILLPLVAACALTGCTTPFRAPPDVAHITLERSDSPVVVVEKIWLDRAEGELAVNGYVVRRLAAVDTTGTHLDVTLYDAAGAVLLRTMSTFEPRQIPRHHRQSFPASYRVPLNPLPAATARIEVRAHEGSHS